MASLTLASTTCLVQGPKPRNTVSLQFSHSLISVRNAALCLSQDKMAWEAQKTAKTMERDRPGQLVLQGMVMLPRRRQSRNLAVIRSYAQHQSVLQ